MYLVSQCVKIYPTCQCLWAKYQVDKWIGSTDWNWDPETDLKQTSRGRYTPTQG
jgi:hypothetical protein